ncbi:hypothetical protein COCOR_00864 [Corallococcus coralloides DSM 2259]|uniref:Uncharacterized protein n=1 Tax=Corallococcus coralloides (strain ATCC 25202 / DSM 2259 / NBRC 100086 / M2) TaxID=1144275 RepID=H8MK32_CORCM|nr:hypothetical protein [Corallococcus coralloides]AFE03752.1 hypothetical protein COCOR_00864 [Corallococcus coralloides DSM 2259]
MTSRLALFAALCLGSLLFGLSMLATAFRGVVALPVALGLGLGLLALVIVTLRRAPRWRNESAFTLSGSAWRWLSLAGALLSGLGATAVVLDKLALPLPFGECLGSSCEVSYSLTPLVFVSSFLGGWLVSAALLGAYGLLRAISSAAVWAVGVSVGTGAGLLYLIVHMGP